MGDGIRIRPASQLTDSDLAAIRAHKAELLAMLSEPVRCASCGQPGPVMLAMAPGPDGEPWSLCSRCYRR